MPLGELRSAWRAEPRDHRVALVVIAVVGVALRLLTISQPMRYDEAVTWLEFARYPLSRALSSYQYPNNHLFHTLLVKGAVSVFGNAPWVLRLPAFLSGIAVIPMAYAVTRKLYGARPALISTALVAASGMLAMFATNARGYSMIACAFLALVLIAASLIQADAPRLWIAFAVVAALGAWTIPVMLYPLGAASLWLALNLLVDGRRRELMRLCATLIGAAALTLLLYWPVFAHAGVAAVVRNKFVESTEWTQFLNEFALLGWSTLKSWGLGLPAVASAVLLAAVVVGLLRQDRHSTFRVGLPLAAFVWCAWLLVATHRAPEPRVWMWSIPIAAAMAGVGVVHVLDQSTKWAGVAARLPAAAAGLSLAAAASVTLSGAVPRNRDTGAFVDAQATALQLKPILRDGDRIVALIPANAPLAYYLDRLGVDQKYMRLEEGAAKRLIVVVNEGERETLDEVIEGIATKDPSQFGMSVIADRPLSKVYIFERRNAPK